LRRLDRIKDQPGKKKRRLEIVKSRSGPGEIVFKMGFKIVSKLGFETRFKVRDN